MNNNNKLGIIAGEGKFPVLIAKEAKAKGIEVYVAGSKGNTNIEDFNDYASKSILLKLGQLNAGIKFFKENGVSRAVMAGRVKHISIFSVMPDLRAAKILASLKDKRAESLLGAAIKEFEKEGIEFLPSSLFLESCIPQKGVLTKRHPTDEDLLNIELGLKVSRAMAALDVGLTCVLADKAIIALEGMEGTDQCILRAGAIYKAAPVTHKSSIIVVKVARPQQDDRYDLPVIGKGTIKSMVEANAQVLAIEASKTIVLDIEEVIAMANDNKIILCAV